MTVAKRVTLQEDKPCSKCKAVMPAGTVAVKDSRPEAVSESRVKDYRDKVWYHTVCPTGRSQRL